MKIIFNSDVLYNFALARPAAAVPAWLCEFCRRASENGSSIVLPETVILELQRIHEEDVKAISEKLKEAQELLNEWGLSDDDVMISDAIQERDFVQELRNCGVEVAVEIPTIDDFRDAQRRACFRLPPHPPRSQSKKSSKDESDEMRDLVIWSVAVRIAQAEGGALLMSKDRIHTAHYGDDEANSVHLFRQKGADQALQFLGVETPSETRLKQILMPVWPLLREEGLPIGEGIPLHRIKAKAFVESEQGLSQARGHVRIQLGAGQSLEAEVNMEIRGGILKKVQVSEIKGDGGTCPDNVTLCPEIQVEERKYDYLERLEALRSLL
ncbi:PIN domain-containing protein [Rhodocaloribacter sp.]